MKKIAVILLNLGGPDNPESVKPFLFNLFNDKAIINLPNPLRFILAKFISSKRESEAQEIYAHIGGKSPILPETEAQSAGLSTVLSSGDDEYKIFISMRYWHPFAVETIKQVRDYQPDEVVLLPLYPQFSTTTTGSSINEWNKLAQKYLPHINIKAVCCYPKENKFIESHIQLIKNKLAELEITDISKYKFLFSAHGLPQKIVDGGDPYQWQVEQSVAAIVDKLDYDNLDHIVCYQSKVGPLEWLKPATDDVIVKCGQEGKGVIIIPVAFVSEHSETLVELDIEYKHLADENGVPDYIRVPTLSVDSLYIEALADLCKNAAGNDNDCSSAIGERICPKEFSKCLMEAS